MRLNPILTTRTYALTALSLSNFVRTIATDESVQDETHRYSYIVFAVAGFAEIISQPTAINLLSKFTYLFRIKFGDILPI